MSESKIIYQADQEVIGKHLRAKEWIMYSGKLIIFDRKTKPVVLRLKSKIYDTFLNESMDKSKEFKANSVSEVYEKLAKWYYKNGIMFQN